jgi:hypothetical protein
MFLSRKDADLVFKLHCALMQFVLEQVQGTGDPTAAAAYRSLPAQQRQEVVKAFLGRLDLIDAFIAANPTRLSVTPRGDGPLPCRNKPCREFPSG